MQRHATALVEALHNPACYPHPVDRVELVETHISWVFLAGEYAYKLKKPVDFGFLDFSSLEKRQHFCREELRLNRRFAPQLYLDVVSVGGSVRKPRLGTSPALDYLVKMRRFSRDQELDQLLEKGQLNAQQLAAFADYLADQHRQAPQVDPVSEFGTPAAIEAPLLENFSQLRPLLASSAQQQLSDLQNWSQTSFEQLRELMKQRQTHGFIRECHGDAHLANMLWLDGQPLLFDCIEFNESFRCIDTVNDIAFLLMDLDDHNAAALGWAFLNRYLLQCGDYAGLQLLNFYKCYRALVRAKVAGLRLQQSGLSARERELDSRLLHSYLDLASGYQRRREPPLLITHGFSGAGKTTIISRLAPRLGAVTVHSDVERKRLYGLPPTAQSRSEVNAGLYSSETTAATYRKLLEIADGVLTAGFPVILDATFLHQWQRAEAGQLADKLKVPFLILDFPVAEAELGRRVEQRSRQAGQLSEADKAILQQQLREAEPLSGQETGRCLEITEKGSYDKLVADIKASCD